MEEQIEQLRQEYFDLDKLKETEDDKLIDCKKELQKTA